MSSIFGGGDAGKAATEAANIQAEATESGIEEQRRQFDVTREDLSRYRGQDAGAIEQYRALLGLGGMEGSTGQTAISGFGTGAAQQPQTYEQWAAAQSRRGRGGGGQGIYKRGDTVFIPESMRGTGGYGDYGLLPSGTYGGVTGGDIGIEYYGGDQAGTADTSQSAYDEYIAGINAQQTQAAPSAGISPLDAQQAAFESLVESPGQRFIRGRAEEGVTRQAAALGGLGGGRVRTALTEQAAGFAQQDLQNRYARLQNLISGGQAAAGQTGQFGAQTAGNISNLMQQGGQARASGILGAQQAQAQQSQQTAGLIGAGLSAGISSLAPYATAALFSDERLKEDIHDLDLKSCFEAVIEIPLKSWRYLESAGLDTNTHLGPMAAEAPEMVKAGEMGGYEVLSLHDELMMIAGAIQYMKDEGMLKCH